VEARLANMPRCLIGMEACVGAHHLSRRLSTPPCGSSVAHSGTISTTQAPSAARAAEGAKGDGGERAGYFGGWVWMQNPTEASL